MLSAGISDDNQDWVPIISTRCSEFLERSPRTRNDTASQKETWEGLLNRFPYALYYRVLVDRIRVLAVYHTARDPSWRQGRV